MRNNLVVQIAALTVGLFSATGFAQDGSRTSMGIHGCLPTNVGMAASADGRIVFAGCEGPTGVFYSRDQGRNWTFAGVAGSAYEYGQGTALFLTATNAYRAGENSIVMTPLPVSADAAWSPSWAVAPGGEDFLLKAQHGKFLLGVDTYPVTTSRVKVYDTETGSVVDSELAPSDVGTEGWKFYLEGVVGGYLIGSFGAKYSTEQQQNAAVYKIPFDSTSGAINGTWEKISLMENGLPAAQGLPAPYTPMSGWYHLSNLVLSPHGRLYVSFPLISYSKNQPIYVSEDLGATFSEELLNGITPLEGNTHAYSRLGGMSFTGDMYLLEDYLSVDRGATWTAITGDYPAAWRSENSISLEPSVGFLEPGGRWALIRTNIGFARVSTSGSDLRSGRTWEQAEGFLAMDLKVLAKAFINPNTAVVSTTAGFSITRNFLSENPAWVDNYCPGGDCFGGRAVAAHPSDPDTFFLGGDTLIFITTLDANGKPDESKTKYIGWGPLVSERSFYGQLYTNSSALPNTLAVALVPDGGGSKGALIFYDLTKPACEGVRPQPGAVCGADQARKAKFHSPELGEIEPPVSKVIAVSDRILFAVGGASSGGSMINDGLKGLFRSDDGGSTFNKITDEGFSALQGWRVSDLAYEHSKDTLYVTKVKNEFSATTQSGLMILQRAAAGNQTWKDTGLKLPSATGTPAAQTVTAIAVDPLTGLIALGGQELNSATVWVSTDGKTAERAVAGLESEKVNFISFDEVVQGSAAAPSKRRMVQGASTGLYESDVAPPASCKLLKSGSCGRISAKGTSCSLAAELKQGKKALKAAPFQLMTRKKTSDAWVKAGKAQKTDKTGRKTFKVKVKKGYQYKLESSAYLCRSTVVRY